MRFVSINLLILFLCFGNLPANDELSRIPLKPEKTTIPTTAKPIEIGNNQTVYFDMHAEVYIFTYQGAENRVTHEYFELPTKADVIVEGAVEPSSSPETLIYRYAVHSLPSSREGVWTFAITAPIKVSQPNTPEGWMVWLLPGSNFPKNDGMLWGAVKENPGTPPPKITYVHTTSEVEAKKKTSSRAVALWNSVGIPPGGTEAGFSFQSASLPGTVNCFAQSYQFVSVTYGEPGEPIESLTNKNSHIYLRGRTVGPVLESNAQPALIFKNLKDSIEEALKLHWVDSPQRAAELTKLVAAASAAWQQKKSLIAKKKLTELISKSEKENGKAITSELYAILKFNAEALLATAKQPHTGASSE